MRFLVTLALAALPVSLVIGLSAFVVSSVDAGGWLAR